MDGGDCTSSCDHCLDFFSQGNHWCGEGRRRAFLRIPYNHLFRGEKIGEEFDATLQDEGRACRGADSLCCGRDHDEYECCFSPDCGCGIWTGEPFLCSERVAISCSAVRQDQG